MGIAILIRITMIVITTIISTNVKPRRRRQSLPAFGFLPIGIIGAIARFLHCLAMYVEHVLPAPALRGGFVLVAAQRPLGGVRERIDWNLSQKIQLLPVGTWHLDSFYKDVEAFRIAIGPSLNLPEVRRI